MQNSGGTQITLPHLSKINKILIIALAAGLVLQSLIGKLAGISLGQLFGLSANLFFKGLIFQLISYPFLATGIMEVIFGGLILWFLGSELENNWGAKRYSWFLIVCSVGAGVVYLLISLIFFRGAPVYSYPLVGVQGITNALCLAYGVIYPDRTFLFMLIFPVKAKYFCGLLVLIQLYMGLMSSSSINGVLAWGHLASMGFAFLFMIVVTSPKLREILAKRTRKKSKAKLKVLYGDKNKDNNPKYWQ